MRDLIRLNLVCALVVAGTPEDEIEAKVDRLIPLAAEPRFNSTEEMKAYQQARDLRRGSQPGGSGRPD